MLFSILLGSDNSEMLIPELFNEYMVMTDLSGDPYGVSNTGNTWKNLNENDKGMHLPELLRSQNHKA